MTRRSLFLVSVLVLGGVGDARGQGRSGSDSPGQQAFADAMKAFESDDFPAAEQKFKEAISSDSALVDAYWRLASIYYSQKKYKDAIDVLRRAPDQQNLDVREQLGLSLYKSVTPPPPESVKLLEDVIARRPTSFASQAQLGQYLLKVDPKRAAAAFEMYLKSRPPATASSDALFEEKLATAYILSKQFDEAVRICEQLLKQKPNDPTAKAFLGTALVGKCVVGDLKACSQAITLYERMLSDAPKQPAIYYNLGTAYLRVGRGPDAQREADLYVKAKPTDGKGSVLLGDAHFAQGHFDKALSSYQMARNLDRNNTSIVAKIGLTDVKLKNYDAAISELEQAEALAPNDVDILCALVDAHGAKKNKDKLSAKADKLAPMTKDSKALSCAAQGYYLNGNDEKAMPVLQASLSLDPNNGVAKITLVRVFNRLAGHAIEKNELAKAQQLLVDAEKQISDDTMTSRNLGLVYLLGKRCAEAERPLLQALKKQGANDMVTNRLLARAYLCQAKRDQAKAAYEKAAQTALRTRGLDLANIYTELGPMYAEGGQLDQAVTVLETAVKEAGSAPVGMTAQRNLAIVVFQRGLERLRDPKQADLALEDVQRASQMPKGILSVKEAAGVVCYEWEAALKAGKVQQASDAIVRAKTGGGCTLKPPYDKMGTAFLDAYTGYRDGSSLARREAAVKTFTSLVPKVTGGTGDWLKQLLRSTYELLAYDYFQKSDEKRAETSLRGAARVPAKGDKRELDHNLAVIDLTMGRTGSAEKVFDALAGRPAESLVNLGIIKDRQGDGKSALSLYRRALDRGARAPKLREWIDVKTRLYGGGQ